MIKSVFGSTSFLLLVFTLLMQGCANKTVAPNPTPQVKPQITASYLFEHRIISQRTLIHKKTLTTLPFEIKTFDETYILNLIAEIPTDAKTEEQPTYYLWIQRQAKNWQDYTHVYSAQVSDLTLTSPYSGIREGTFYTNYVITLTYEQLQKLKNEDLYLTLTNTQKGKTLIELPQVYLEAFVMMINHSTNAKP